jgi:alcohol dehydrogenase (cytochrome c)
MAINYVRAWSAPRGTTTTEIADAPAGGAPATISATSTVSRPGDAITGDWPNYNKTLTSERYSSLNQINTTNWSSQELADT